MKVIQLGAAMFCILNQTGQADEFSYWVRELGLDHARELKGRGGGSSGGRSSSSGGYGGYGGYGYGYGAYGVGYYS